MKRKNRAGLITPLPPLGPVADSALDSCTHIVALMGAEPYIAAIEGGADIVLGGRTTDTAVLAAVPLHLGAGTAASWHAAKIAECGGQCTTNPREGGVLLRVFQNAFDIEPLSATNRCTPNSVSAHMLYETSDPFRLIEPGGILDVSEACYEAVSERVARARGARWQTMPYTMKLEGARGTDFQTIMIMGIEDPEVLADLDGFHDTLARALQERVRAGFPDEAFDISLRFYGWNGTSGRAVPPDTLAPADAGVLFVVTARTQEIANEMAKACNPYLFHMPLRAEMEIPSYAFPFTPAEIPRGQVYEFLLNHVVAVEHACELVRTEWAEMANARARHG